MYFPYKSDRMHWFCKVSPEQREFHLYLIEPAHQEWKSRLALRDYLRNQPNIAQECVAIKTKLANKFRNDREAHTQEKTQFIRSVIKEAFK